jgi:ATP-dependent Clp protease ATP-binding subunit ClpA
MFERFTDRARRVVVLAQEEARLLSHSYIGTEHILLGLIHEGEGVAAKALESLGISLEAVRNQVEEIIGQGGTSPSGHIPFTPRAKKVLELSLREALQLGHNYIGTEHILLGLIREGEGVSAQVLVKLGADLSSVRQQVIRLLSDYDSPDRRVMISERMRSLTLDALVACWAGDLEAMHHQLGDLVRLAAASGDQEQLDLLASIVDIDDPERGEIRLKSRRDD